jgi:hypothetical protein
MVEDRLFAGAGPPSLLALLVVFLLSLGLTAGQFIQLVFPARTWAPKLDRLGVVVGIFLASLLSLEVVHQSDIWLANPWQIPLAILIFCLAAIVPYVHWWLSKTHGRARTVSRYVLRGTLALLCATAAGWSGERYYALVDAFDNLGLLLEVPGEMEEVHRYVAITDTGSRLPLFRWDITDDEFREYRTRSATRLSGMAEAAIPRAEADRRANCHGWVFTGGRFLLNGPQVERILKENGYTVTDMPQPEDLVVYRNNQGQIVHTGVVRGVLDDGTVMVESKFGLDGRYLHQPQDQPFSQKWAYYRSTRAGHYVTIERSRWSHASDRQEKSGARESDKIRLPSTRTEKVG